MRPSPAALIGRAAWPQALLLMSAPAMELRELRITSAYSPSAVECASGGTVLIEYATLQNETQFRVSRMGGLRARHHADLREKIASPSRISAS